MMYLYLIWEGIEYLGKMIVFIVSTLILNITKEFGRITMAPKRIIGTFARVAIKVVTTPLVVAIMAFYMIRYKIQVPKKPGEELTKALVDNQVIR